MTVEQEKARESLDMLARAMARGPVELTEAKKLALMIYLMGVIESGLKIIADARAGAREPYEGAVDDVIKGSLDAIKLARISGALPVDKPVGNR